jgi:hypothetical protein
VIGCAFPAVVNHRGATQVVIAPSRSLQLVAQVYVFGLHEIAGGKPTHLLEALSRHHQAGT